MLRSADHLSAHHSAFVPLCSIIGICSFALLVLQVQALCLPATVTHCAPPDSLFDAGPTVPVLACIVNGWGGEGRGGEGWLYCKLVLQRRRLPQQSCKLALESGRMGKQGHKCACKQLPRNEWMFPPHDQALEAGADIQRASRQSQGYLIIRAR